MPNYRVACLRSSELRFCVSENEVSQQGWSLVLGRECAAPVESMPDDGVKIEVAPGFSEECVAVFRDGELQGDLHTAELSNSRTRLCFAPVPPIE
jgi:hypothetical protein